jgi:hypothetical protein
MYMVGVSLLHLFLIVSREKGSNRKHKLQMAYSNLTLVLVQGGSVSKTSGVCPKWKLKWKYK